MSSFFCQDHEFRLVIKYTRVPDLLEPARALALSGVERVTMPERQELYCQEDNTPAPARINDHINPPSS